MAKFCGNCGMEMEDNAKVCGKCGTPYGNTSTQAAKKIPGVGEVNPENKKRIKRTIRLIIAGIVLVAVAVGAFNVLSEFTGYKGALRKVISAYEAYDMNTLFSMTSDAAFYSNDQVAQEEYYADLVSDRLDQYESQVGRDIKITYVVDDAYKLSERKLESLLSHLESSYEYDTSDIKEVMSVELTITIKGNKGNTRSTGTLLFIKEDNSWKVYYPNFTY